MTDYRATRTTHRFHQCADFIRGLMGPIGSGKSVACCMEIMLKAAAQAPASDGVRYSRWVVIRNTYRELQDTTLKTWFDWVPEYLGQWRAADMTHTITQAMPDRTTLQLEVLFRALDRPEDIKKLLSLELTGAWINEAREVPRPVLDMLQGRVGRYPSARVGGPSWFGIILDTNPPDNDHWWYRLFEEERPSGWSLFRQPSGLSLKAENLENLPPDYYKRLQVGHDSQWIDVYVHGKYGFISDGRPVYPEYNDTLHAAADDLEVVPHEPLIVGLDFGLTPAAVICQEHLGQFRVLDELVTERMGAVQFAGELKRKLARDYPGLEVRFYGDPAGEQSSQTDEETVYQALYAHGIDAVPAPSNDFTIRREAVVLLMGQLTMTGEPGFLISPRAKTFRKGMAGGYKYRRIQVSNEERYQDKPDKGSIYSHVCDAGQYAVIGAGHGNAVIGSDWGSSGRNINREMKERLYG
jgi:hypothetical protein